MDLSRHWNIEKLAEVSQGRILQGNPKTVISSVSTDTRLLKKGDLFWAIDGPDKSGNEFVPAAARQGAAAAVVGKEYFAGLSPKFPLVKVPSGLHALGRFAEEHRLLFPKAAVVGVTGTNGKTTTKEMTARVLAMAGQTTASRGNFNNEIGCPLSILELTAKHDFMVLEMAARKKGDVAYLSLMGRPKAVILTNVSAAHLETFGSEENVFETKAEILKGLMPGGTVIYWAEDPWLGRLRERWPNNRYLTFGLGPTADVFGQIEEHSPQGITFGIFYEGKKQGSLKMPGVGAGPVKNSLAAFAAGLAFNAAPRKIINALAGFTPVSMRGEKIVLGGHLFGERYSVINDAYNANPASMADGVTGFLRAYQGWVRIVVMGEMRELGAKEEELHRQTGDQIAEEVQKESSADSRTNFVAVGGRPAMAMAEGLKKCEKKDGPRVQYASKENAFDVIKKMVFQNKPPCALYFKASRAESLESLIEQLKKEF
ncbi:MAG: UDP-N-acetylmuramoyl-tripeptide--D-alanyl-D-alanine ligase [Elusimicrobia bacterium]|nr:UDP-N-acetylmuramoyl-tripeptide--D-alanyl-D-alanine ligase [Elusimicrobiota bacterium]